MHELKCIISIKSKLLFFGHMNLYCDQGDVTQLLRHCSDYLSYPAQYQGGNLLAYCMECQQKEGRSIILVKQSK